MAGSTAYFHRTYDETMALLIEARSYALYHDVANQRAVAPAVRLQMSYESLRVTSRLIQVMAWLLAQKAVDAGELTPEQGADEFYALSGGSICSDAAGPENEALPPGLRSLLDHSYNLYARVLRLDEQVRRNRARRVAV